MVVIILGTVAGLYGCASSDPTDAVASSCQGTDQQDCQARDNARQVRDAEDYQDEPALGYLESPPGLLPVPLTSRNASAN